MAEKDPERRRGQRLTINDEFRDVSASYVTDLSEHGVFVHTSEQVPIGTAIELRFTVLLDDPVVIQGLGRVVRHSADPRGLGVEFGPLSPEMVLRIHDAISRHRPRDSGPPVRGAEATELKTGKFAARRVSEDAFDQAKTGTFAAVPGSEEDDESTVEVLEDSKTRRHPIVRKRD